MNNNFIEAEEFLKQPVEVQQEFMDWWQPKIGDLFELHIIEYNDYGEGSKEQTILRKDEYNIVRSINEDMLKESKEDIIDMIKDVNDADRFTLCLNMSQLIDYIEDKTGGQAEIYPDFYKVKYYTIMLRNTGCGGDDPSFEICTDSLLQALWKVACKIAKESIKYDKNI